MVKSEIDLAKSRFSEAPWLSYLNDEAVTVVGSGGIGSWVTMCLARIGCRVYLYDADLVETHNLGGQMLRTNSVGESKVDEVRNLSEELTSGAIVVALNEMFDATSAVDAIMISAVDNMATRKLMFDKWVAEYSNDKRAIFIDGRLLAEDYQVYAVTPDRINLYRATLFSDEEVPTENCSLKATTHCSLGIASEIVGCLTNWAANIVASVKLEPQVRDVPFSIIKSMPNFLYDLTFNNDTKEKGDDNTGVLSTPAPFTQSSAEFTSKQ